MNKIIAIYFSDPEPMDYPFNKDIYLEQYQKIITEIEKNDIQVFIVRGNSYVKNGRFEKGWRFINGELKETEGEIKADLIFNRDDKNTIPLITDCRIINHPDLDRLCVDKIKTFEMFPEMSPKTALVNTFSDCLKTVKNWGLEKNDLIVLKENFETEGRGIFVLPLREIKKELYDSWNNTLVQEFIDSSVGLPGITKGLHDLRIAVVNDQPINAYVRQPAEGSYLANIAKGGSGMAVDLKDISSEVMENVREISRKLNKYFPAVYSADFMNSPKGYKLIELNSRPGIQHPKYSKNYKKFNDAVTKMLIEAVKNA